MTGPDADTEADAAPTNAIRRDELTQALVDVLLDSDAPRPAGDVIAAVEQRLPWTAFERSRNDSGVRRAQTFLQFTSGWLATLGWLAKADGRWSLTPAGRTQLVLPPGDEQVYRRIQRAYREHTGQAAPLAGEQRVVECLDALPDDGWTTYGDIAAVTGHSAQGVGGILGRSHHPRAYRVLTAGGTVGEEFRWPDPQRTDDPRDLLAADGIALDADGRAPQAQRVTADELRAVLAPDAEPVQRAWLVRGSSVQGRNLVPTWLAEGWCSVAATQVRNLALPLDRPAIVRVVEEDYAGKSYNQRGQKVTELDGFINRIAIDDLVVTNDGSDFYVGRVTGPAESVPATDGRSGLRRDVDWLTTAEPVDLVDLPPGLAAKVSSSQTLVDLSAVIADVRALLPTDDDHGLTPDAPLTLPAADESLSAATLFDHAWLQQTIDLLSDRRQVILYGPPGTGKTYLATRLARHLAGADGTTLVQFHPAYGYEDFFEGYRPTTTDAGAIAFELKPGPFRRIVDAARENPTKPYVLVIDEINRANLAKVFGELYFLLEYRDHAIDLLYRSGDEDAFTLPENVFIIGTMNTADRSIALVDAAMRRRFAFRALHPDVEPTRSLLRRWLRGRGLPETTADLLDVLNRAIGDTDLAIGPSYFMRDSVHRDGGLDLLWESDILPLLEEHHVGQGIDVAERYALGRLRRALDAAAAGDPDDR